MMSDDPLFVCLNCHRGANLSELTEVEEEKLDHSHFECPDCGGEKFSKHPPRNTEQQQKQEPPEDYGEEDSSAEPRHRPPEQRREHKRQQLIRSLERRR